VFRADAAPYTRQHELALRLTVCVPGHVRSITPIVQGVMVVARETEFAAGKTARIRPLSADARRTRVSI